MMDDQRKSAPIAVRNLDRRTLLRHAGLLGVGAVGLGLGACKQRPDDDLADPTSPQQVLQEGGTVTATVSGLLAGEAVSGARLHVSGMGTVEGDDRGVISVRIPSNGEYEVEFRSDKHVRRAGAIQVAGNVTVGITMLEKDAGVSMRYLDDYARGLGSGKGITIRPRTPGFTNRWNFAPTFRLYRRLEDSSKEFVSDARIDAMRAAITSLFPALTANRIGFPAIEVRSTTPQSMGEVPSGTVIVAQRKATTPTHEAVGSFQSEYALSKAGIGCGFESPIEIFNQMVGYSTGAYGVNSGETSVMSLGGAAAPSEKDLLAARFLYSRVAGNSAPDEDPDGVFLN